MSVLTRQVQQSTVRRAPALWLFVLGIVLAALNLRTGVSSVGPLLDQITNGLHMSSVTLGLLTALPVLSFAAFGALTPALARRIGEHRLLLIALATLAVGLLLRSMVGSAAIFLLASAVALTGGAVGNVLIPTLIKRHYPDRAGVMTTVYTTALAVGSMLAAAGTVPIERAAGGNWRVALGVWAALAVVAAIPWLALLRNEPERDTGRHDVGPGALVRSKLAWSVAVYFGTQSMIAYIMFGWLAKILTDGGYTTGQAGLILGVFSALSIPVSLVVPTLATRFRNQRPLIVGLVACYTIGFLGLWFAPISTAWVWTVFVALGMGSFPLALTMLALRTRSAEGTTALSAFGQSVGYLIAAIGPLMVGVLYEATGGWSVTYALILVVIGVQFVAGWYAGANRYLEDEPGMGALRRTEELVG